MVVIKMLSKINKLTTWQASLIIIFIGLATFFSGLLNPFMGDDIAQIVNSLPVHSISNIRLFFEGSTFYNGQSLLLHGGIYYRPLMTTVYSLLYTLFGPHTFYFHLLQLSLYIASAILVCLVFRYFFKPALALCLALVFLVHPVSSQVVYSIPSMQDALFFFFGMLALYLLIRFSSVRSLLLVAFCLLLSLLSKETAVAFIIMVLLYLAWFDRRRLYGFIGIMVLPVMAYLLLRVNAVGFFGHGDYASIDNVGLGARLLTAPSIVLFFLWRFIWPLKLARAYYWINPAFSLRHVLLPLTIDAAVLGLIVYIGVVLYKKLPRDQFLIYGFFAAWTAIGLLLYLQIVPLDMTACETWLYFPMVGLLGMIGVVLAVCLPHFRINPYWLLIIAVLLIGALGIRSALRGHDYRNQVAIAYQDIAVSKEDYNAYDVLANDLILQGNLNQAKVYALDSVSIYPNVMSYNTVGAIYCQLGDFTDAQKEFMLASDYKYNYQLTFDNLAIAEVYSGDAHPDIQKLASTLRVWPKDGSLWYNLAILENRVNDNADALQSLNAAGQYGFTNQSLYQAIMSNKPYTFTATKTAISF